MEGNPNRHKRYLVDPHFQYWLIGRITTMSLLIIAASLVCFAVVYRMNGDVTIGLAQPSPFDATEGKVLVAGNQSLLDLLWPVLIGCLLGTLIVTSICGLFLSRHMANPMDMMQNMLLRMADGDLTIKVNLQRDDAFKSMAGSINRCAERWHRTAKELQDICAELEPAVQDGRGREQVMRLREALLFFKTE